MGVKMIHIRELQRIALKLSNSVWVRWYAHWNYPQRNPWKVAISLVDVTGQPIELYEPDLPIGWQKVQDEKTVTYVWERADDKGNLYKGEDYDTITEPYSNS